MPNGSGQIFLFSVGRYLLDGLGRVKSALFIFCRIRYQADRMISEQKIRVC
ncbi:hypothetical protein HMPREF1988_00061 [Porphyromonas gingivalis F0185]|uniref:Uncharacterized protein n=1 Tax=Porphyromonas gingivalis F0570 TaxID=1227271 RepID=A0A0E2LQG9_PORGN|nr:hypothetical protein HMPREF1555_01157 [Porphyromonas gingivalis F0570]ERJ69225.1 hypothetical protein HMPREF1553_00682 [Porphyromonas gingivalis F0568]ERJ86306.1 hypothetical protein HMPREF1988_00061 [Porphyromonas gingivalis F0185]